MKFLKLRTRKRIMFFLFIGTFLLLIGTGNFYIGYTKSIQHQNTLQTLVTENNLQLKNSTIINDESISYGTENKNLIREIKKISNRMNYYKIASIGGTIFILIGLAFIFTVLYLRL